jgi:beta-glucosidase
MPEEKILKFPYGFLWGTSTSAYQIEGGIVHSWVENGKLNNVDIYNDWSMWEISRKRKDYLINKRKNLYDFLCLKACDSYNRYKEDLDLAMVLNNNAIRISLEWSRIEIQKETWDVGAINHYRDLLSEAKKRNMKTVVTLWHWTNPLWFTVEGGWANKKAIDYYLKYVQLVVQELGSYIDYWVTLNEPMVHIVNGYITGKFPPNKHNLIKAEKAYKHLAEAHNQAYNIIHDHFPNAPVGFTGLINYYEPAHKWNPIEIAIAKIAHYFGNHRFLKKTIKKCDFIGLDYYFHDRIVWYPPFKRNKNKQVSDIGWEIYPEGIYHVLKYLHKFNKPIMVLENGLSDANDSYRKDFIRDHLFYIHKAIKEGVPVKGYFHWSLLDNFEWAHGFVPKFGLYEVNRRTFERTPRQSAFYYAEICKSNSIII